MNEDSIKDKLKKFSKETGNSFIQSFKQLTFERFLARVAISDYRSNLIFKGGLCLKQYIDLKRETKDIDFLFKNIDENIKEPGEIFQEISQINLEDYYIFENVTVARLDGGHKQHPGYRIKIKVKLGNMKDSLQIDLGVGDSVDEYEMGLNLLKYLDHPLISDVGITVMAYPPEFIFSEKLQAIVSLKALNSRMKDYFDCYKLIINKTLDSANLKVAITKTFERRGTKLEGIGDYSQDLERTWEAFIKKIGHSKLELSNVVFAINDFLRREDIFGDKVD